MHLPRLAVGFSVIGSLLLFIGQSAYSVAESEISARPVEIVIQPMVIEESGENHDHDHEEELKEASKSAAVRRRLYSEQPVVPARRVQPLLSVVDQKDILEKHRVIADETLRSIHSECRTHLKNFYVRYDNPENRGLGGGSTIILSGNVPDDEFRALLVHECGHVIDTGAWKGNASAGITSFSDGNQPIYADDLSMGFYSISWSMPDKKKKGVSEADFVSGYASWNAFEDFAESFAYYTLHREEFLERALKNEALMAKYRFMAAHVDGKLSAQTEHDWNGNVPWDITKLPYRWLADQSEVGLTLPAR